MDTNRNSESGFKTPAQIVLIVALSIFVAEAAIMLMLRFLPSLPPSTLAFSDAMMLVLLVSPILYFFLFRPLVLHIQHLRKVEAELLKNEEEQFKIMIRTAMDGFCIIDMQGRLLEANDAYCRLTGYGREELLGMNVRDLEVTESAEETAQHIRRLFEIGSDSFETQHRCKDGSILDIEVSANYSHQLDGRVYCFLRDIRDRKRYELQLQRWQEIFRNAEWGVVVGNADCSSLDLMNPAFARVHGYTVEELMGQPIAHVLSPESCDSLNDHLQRARQLGHYSFESMQLRKDGSEFPALMDVTVVYDKKDVVLYHVVNVQDITERRKIEIAIRTSEESLRHAQAVAQTGSWALDVRHNVLTWTEESYRIFGVPPGTPLNYEIFLSCVHPDDRGYVDQMWNLALQGAAYDIEHRIVVNGTVRWVRERAELEIDAKGALIGGIGTTQDVTERKNVEIALAESRQLLRSLVAENEAAREQERKKIAREVHDELGQILTALRMDVSLLRIRYGKDKGALLEKLQGMMGLVDRAIHSVRDVAANLRPAALDMGVLSALEWLCEEFSEHAGIPCTLRPSADYFNLDESRSVMVFRIVQESLTNVARHAKATEVVIDIDQRGGDLSIQVCDNGKGFDLAARSNKKSFGLLGMHERAIALGGDVDIISAPGKGTVISVRIPITQNATES